MLRMNEKDSIEFQKKMQGYKRLAGVSDRETSESGDSDDPKHLYGPYGGKRGAKGR